MSRKEFIEGLPVTDYAGLVGDIAHMSRQITELTSWCQKLESRIEELEDRVPNSEFSEQVAMLRLPDGQRQSSIFTKEWHKLTWVRCIDARKYYGMTYDRMRYFFKQVPSAKQFRYSQEQKGKPMRKTVYVNKKRLMDWLGEKEENN